MDPWPWRISAIIGAALLPPSLLLAEGVGLELLTVGASLGAFVATVVGPRLHPSEHAGAFRLLHPSEHAGAFRLLRLAMGGFAASTILDFSPLGLTAPNPVAGLTLLLYLASFVTVGLAMFRLAESRMGGGDTEGRIDAALIAIATAAVLYDLIAVPAMAATSDPVVHIVFAALPLLQAPVAAVGVRLLISGAHRLPSAWMFAAAATVGVVGSVAEMTVFVEGASTLPVSALWLIVYTLVACGALHPSARRLGAPVGEAGLSVSVGRLAVIAAALLSMPLTLLAYERGNSRAPAIAATLSVVLVLWRAVKLLLERERANEDMQRRAQREAALSSIGHAAVVADGAAAFVAGLPAIIDGALGTTTTIDERPRAVAPGPPPPTVAGITAERLVWLGQHSPALLVRFCDTTAAEDAGRFLATVADIAAGATRRWRAEELLRHQSLHDTLTGLPNRALVSRTLQHALDRRHTSGDPLLAMFIDLDGFKTVNDTLGHAAGDVVLGEVAERLRRQVRPQDVVGRLAGDEFVVVCEALLPTDALDLGHALLGVIAEPFSLDLGDATIGASIGVATARHGETAEALLQRADAAMYHAKHQGKGRVAVAGDGPVLASPVA